MRQSTRTTRRESGSVLVLIAVGLVTIVGAAALAVDVGYLSVYKNQLQNASDAAALAGAQGLAADPSNFSASGQAKQLAIQIAAQNQAARSPVQLSDGEITFPDGNTVRVQVTRPAPTFFARVFGVSQVDVRVTAAATVVPVNAVGGGPGGGGIRPWAVLDQFSHGALCVPPNDADVNHPAHGPFNDRPHTWNGVTVQSDRYVSPYNAQFDGWDLSREGDCGNVTGFIAPRDVTNQRVYLKSSSWLTPGNYGAVALGGNGADTYRDNIIHGYSGVVEVGDVLTTEPGNMVGPTNQGVTALIAEDPTARMVRNSAGRWVVMSDKYGINESPRIVPIPMYSVYDPPGNGRSTLTVTSISAFFVEGTDGKDVWGKFIYTRTKNGRAMAPTSNSGSQSVGGGGRLLSTVRMVNTTN
jgi:Flp pilus assembly protein TadG